MTLYGLRFAFTYIIFLYFEEARVFFVSLSPLMEIYN